MVSSEFSANDRMVARSNIRCSGIDHHRTDTVFATASNTVQIWDHTRYVPPLLPHTSTNLWLQNYRPFKPPVRFIVRDGRESEIQPVRDERLGEYWK